MIFFVKSSKVAIFLVCHIHYLHVIAKIHYDKNYSVVIK